MKYQKRQEAETNQSRLQYNSQIWDELSGLYYLRARYYNPRTGRFTQEDVIYDDGLNLYAYCNSNPVIYSETSGFAKQKIDPCDPKTGEGNSQAQYIEENGVPLDRETVLGNDSYTKIKLKVKGASVYKNGDKYYYRDTLHKGERAHLEVFDKKGNHLGEANPLTGGIIPNTADKSKKLKIN